MLKEFIIESCSLNIGGLILLFLWSALHKKVTLLLFQINKMAGVVHGILFSNAPVNRGTYSTARYGEESFLHEVITPIYEVMRKVVHFFK